MQAPGLATCGGAKISETRVREWPPRRLVTLEVAEMLAAARRNRGWSLRRAAREIGCTPGTVVHLEKRRRAPSTVLAGNIIDAYDLDDAQADMLLAEAVDNAGRSSPYKR